MFSDFQHNGDEKMPENYSPKMRKKAQRVKEFTVILVGAELYNLYSGKCLSYTMI